MPLGDSNQTEENDYAITNINGNTDNTQIGNVGDRLKVDAATPTPKNILFEETQLTRDTSIVFDTGFNDAYSYSGSGYLYGVLLDLEGASGAEGARWYVNIKVDDTYYTFRTNGLLISDLTNANIFNITTSEFCGITLIGNVFRISFDRNPLVFNTKIQVQVKRTTSTKKLRAGLLKIYKA